MPLILTGEAVDSCFVKNTYSNQSTAIIKVTSSAGRPTVSNTMTIVTSPACGIPAAPILAAVAVTLKNRYYRLDNVLIPVL